MVKCRHCESEVWIVTVTPTFVLDSSNDEITLIRTPFSIQCAVCDRKASVQESKELFNNIQRCRSAVNVQL